MQNPDNNYIGIKQWAEDDRPREKMLLKGINALSDAELIAILIATGTKEESAVDLGKKILALTQNNLNKLGKLSLNDLQKIKGIGQAKAITIAAALELGRRRKHEEPQTEQFIKTSKQAFDLIEAKMVDLSYEEFWVIYLARNNKLLAVKKISEGGVSGTVVDPKIIFKHALELLASVIILSHNHPSGNLNPSHADIVLTKKIIRGAKALDIDVADHIIIGQNNFFSFSDENLMQE